MFNSGSTRKLWACQKPFGRINSTYIGNKKPILQVRYLKSGLAMRKSIVNPCSIFSQP